MEINDLIYTFLRALCILIFLGFSTERGTQVAKTAWNTITKKWPLLNLSNEKSFLLNAVIVSFIVMVFGVDITKEVPYLEHLSSDPAFVKLVNILVVVFSSNVTHNKFFRS